jgi:hypothetical protein
MHSGKSQFVSEPLLTWALLSEEPRLQRVREKLILPRMVSGLNCR